MKKAFVILMYFVFLAIFFLIFAGSGVVNGPERLSNIATAPTQKRAQHVAEKRQEPVHIMFGGDAMFDRNIRLAAEQKSYRDILEDLTPLLVKQDLVVVNLEGPITDNASKSTGSEIGSVQNYIFTFSPDVLQVLTANNIKLVNIGNNHTLNFGRDGLKQTINYLNSAGIEFFGFLGKDLIRPSYKIININGLRLGFVNYNQFANGAKVEALESIENVRKEADFVFVYTHWGEEYQSLQDNSIKNLAHEFVDKGADLVVGSHPHVIGQTEYYKGKRIYYSLGNFVFDQYFSQETMQGLLVEVTIDPNISTLAVSEYEVLLSTNGKTSLHTN